MYNVVLPFLCTDCDFANIMTIETQDCESDSLNLLLLLSALPIYANPSCITIYSHTPHTHGEYNFYNIKEIKKEPYKCKICEPYALENLCLLHTLNLYLTTSVKYLKLIREPKCDLFCIAFSKSTHYMILSNQTPFLCIDYDSHFILSHLEIITSIIIKHG